MFDIACALFDQDYVTRMYGIDQRREGKIEGMIEGMIEGKKETALKLRQMGMTIEVISEATGLSKEEIEKLTRGNR